MSNKCVAIIDYGMGNLFSIENACRASGLDPIITSEKEIIMNSPAVILPGVGAFGDGVKALKKLDLHSSIKDFINSGKPFMGICLGMQLLMSESEEFGKHDGLDIIKGEVVKFPNRNNLMEKVKIPHIGWNQIIYANQMDSKGSPLENIKNGEFMYFIHSYFVKPFSEKYIFTTTEYCGIKYCSGIRKGNVFGFQFHPEKSGPRGIEIFKNFNRVIKEVN